MVRLSIGYSDMISYIENLKDSTIRKLLELIKEFSIVAE